jgi:hypothetical protein
MNKNMHTNKNGSKMLQARDGSRKELAGKFTQKIIIVWRLVWAMA